MEARAERKSHFFFQLIPEQDLLSIRHPCYLLKGAKQPLLPLTSEINSSSIFPHKTACSVLGYISICFGHASQKKRL